MAFKEMVWIFFFLIAYVSTLITTTYNVKSNVSLRMHDGKGQDGKYP